MQARNKGRFTFRFSGALFILSAVSELLSLNDGVLLLGAIRGGVIALAYHLAYIVMFVVLGIGLWEGKRWGVKAVMISTALYTLDRLQLLLAPRVLETYMLGELGDYVNSLVAGGQQTILQTTMVMIVLFVASWWAFAWYTYARRDYFKAKAS